MKYASVLSTAQTTEETVARVVEQTALRLEGTAADLTVVFASRDHAAGLGRVSRELRRRGLARHVLGCTGEAIIGEDREVENGPALSLWAGSLPGVTIRPIRLAPDDVAPSSWPRPLAEAGIEGDQKRLLVVLGDPFSFPVDTLLKQSHDAARGLRIVGGMASGSATPAGNRLVLDDEVFPDGAVGMALDGAVAVRTVVSQGCRPVGRPLIVTRAEHNLIRELGRRPALEVLQEVFEGLDADDQERVRAGLHIGRVINEYQERFGRGDFLVRNVLGTDGQGAIALNDVVRVGQTVQFHVRDATTADEDLRGLLERVQPARVGGALLFSCNGRGTRLFPEPNHDVAAIHQVLGPVPVAGFFAMGELGPIGDQNFLHGFTASVVLFEEP